MESIKAGNFYGRKMGDGLFLISCPEWDMPKASVNSWLIEGDDYAVVFDAGLRVLGLESFCHDLVKKEVRLVLTHGHYDHIGAMHEFSELWINKKDEEMLIAPEFGEYGFEGKIHYIDHGEQWDLGNRKIDFINIEGHTKGSMLAIDHKTKTLISGDTIARRLLYMNEEETSLAKYLKNLEILDNYDYENVASAHDRFFLKKDQHRYMRDTIIKELHKTQKKAFSLVGIDFFTIHKGNSIEDPEYLSISLPLKYKEKMQTEVFHMMNDA